ncbi:MBL fold metallo-hydrolase [Natronomonas salsuginis]|uniref:MBL fold metallo-hydrolase n=1 Tax=Natronomonas salsuginis TaxID=2217661 RepID=A0A4U5JAP5_9EURY|nr:MBL fold metallo-hydrolase [Natronomonas salsuginis]TKR26240.1 MBL fold metallo-hydrolase [Natronomonas salsuginis]
MNATDEWYEVSRLTENGYRITEANDYGMFLVEGDERAVLVDAGAGVGELHSVVTDLVDTPITLVLTHTHWDHIGAASQFDDVLVSPLELPPDGRIRVDSLSGEFVERPTQFTNRWVDAGKELPNDFDPSEHAIEPTDADPLPADGRIDLGDRSLEVIELPGHSPGHVGLLDSATDTLYGGDVIHFDHNLYVMFEDCDLEAYADSIARLKDLRDDGAFEVLATSHNEPLSGDDLDIVDDLLEGLHEIAADGREYEIVETDWGEARSYEIGDSDVLTKTTI